MGTPVGPNAPGTMSSDSSGADGAWSNPNNAKVEDGTFCVAPGLTGISSVLSASNLGFAIVGTVTGIAWERKGKANLSSGSGGGGRIMDYSLLLTGLTTSSDKALNLSTTRWTTTNGYSNAATGSGLIYGGDLDLWGNGSVTSGQVNASGFGSTLIVHGNKEDGTEIASVDNLRFTVWYAAGGVNFRRGMTPRIGSRGAWGLLLRIWTPQTISFPRLPLWKPAPLYHCLQQRTVGVQRLEFSL